LRSLKALGKLDFKRFVTALGKIKLNPLTIVEWQKFTQPENDVPEYHKFLEYLDFKTTATEVENYDHYSQRKPLVIHSM